MLFAVANLSNQLNFFNEEAIILLLLRPTVKLKKKKSLILWQLILFLSIKLMRRDTEKLIHTAETRISPKPDE